MSLYAFAANPERIVAVAVLATLILVFLIRGPLKEKLQMEKIGPLIILFLVLLAVLLIRYR